jgi:predicted  nucleic acid-binding Zn-ribbon protein
VEKGGKSMEEIEELEKEIYTLNRKIAGLTLDLRDCLQRERSR